MGASGCVSYLFDRKGLFLIASDQVDEEQLMEVAMEAGAEDIATADENFEVICEPEAYTAVDTALEKAEIKCVSKQVTRIPQNTVDVTSVEDAKKLLLLMELLDDHDDIQNVSANFNIAEEAMAEITEG